MGWRTIPVAALAAPLCLIAELLPIRPYTTAEGLAANHINCIVPDSRGFVWFCTPEGLTRFDGYRWVSFGTADGLAGSSVEAFLETRAGAYFVGTNHGLSQFHSSASGNQFVTYRQGADPFDRAIYALLESSTGRIWCGTSGGLFEVLSASQFRPQPLPGLDRAAVTDIKEDARGRLWVGTTMGGVYVFGKDGAVDRITKKDGLPSEWVNALLLDRAGRLWAGTRSGLALMRDAGAIGKFDVERVYKSDGAAELNVLALAEGSDGAIWIGTGNGISRLFSGKGEPVFRNLTRSNGLSDRAVVALAADKRGNMWAGTVAAGTMRIGSAGFITFREQDGLRTDRVFSVLGDRAGTVLAVTMPGTEPGRSINVFDAVNFEFHTLAPKVFRDSGSWGRHQILLQSRTGEWWGATSSGLCRFAPMIATDLAGRQPNACYAQDVKVFQVFEDSKGGIWASGQSAQGDRLLRWDPGRKAMSWLEDGPNRHQLVSAFAEDHTGNIWMGLWGGGELFCYDGRQFTGFKPADGAPPAPIFTLLVDRGGRLWIGSDGGGLGAVENPGRAPLRVCTYDTAHGLASNTILCLVEDNIGRIYAGTAKGVDRLNPITGRVKHFSSADGLPYGEFRSAFRDRSGNLWFATTQGLSRLTPIPDPPPVIPTVLITDLKIFGKAYPVSQAGETRIRPPKLDPSRNQLQVTFVGFNNEPEENLRYTYKLEGAGSDWTKPDRDHEANYPGLGPGHYRFLVKAVNSEDRQGQTAEIDFEVLPPFWRQWWFEALALSGLAGLVFAAHRYRVAQAVQIERMRTRIATDLHDDIGASLSQIAILSEVLIQRSGDDRDLSGQLSGMAGSARELLASMSDIVWATNPRHDHLRDLQERMRRFASNLFAARNIDFAFTAPADQDLKLGADMRREIYLVFKEAVTNVARHSGCTHAEIDFSRERDWLALRVSDNGQGLPACESGAGHGLLNMQARAKTLGGEVRIASAAGRGTTIALRVPLGRPRAFLWRTPSK